LTDAGAMRPRSGSGRPERAAAYRALPCLVAVAIACLVATSGIDASGRASGICGALSAEALATATWATLHTFDIVDLGVGWVLMVGAMMPPLIAGPIGRVLLSSDPRRRSAAIVQLVLGYAAIWMAAGLVFVPVAFGLMIALNGAAFPMLACLALVWSCSPRAHGATARCCGSTPPMRGRSPKPYDDLREGLSLAVACIVGCWPWMLLAVAASTWHVAVMTAGTAFLTLERLASLGAVRWRLPSVAGLIRPALITA
jgi:hypothetical protein